MSFSDDADYAIGVALPNLRQRSNNYKDEVQEFTETQARNIPFHSLPLRMNHSDDDSSIVGLIEDARTDKLDHMVLLRVDPAISPQAASASALVAGGHYPGLSVSHQCPKNQVPGPNGSLVKYPFEVSLVKEPLRPGSDIKHVFPGRRSLGNFSDDILARFHKTFYDERIEAPPSRKDTNAHQSYIERLWTLVRTDRETTCSKFSLAPIHKPLMSDAAVAEVRGSAQENAPPPVPAAAPDVPEPAPPASSESAPPQNDNLRDPLMTATKLVEAEELAARLKSENAELVAYKEAAIGQERAKKQEETDKAVTVAEAFTQWAEKQFGSDFASKQRKSLDAQIATNPMSAISSVNTLKATLMQASKDKDEANQRALDERARADRAAQEVAFTSLEHRRNVLTSLNGIGSPLATAADAPTLGSSMDARFPHETRASAALAEEKKPANSPPQQQLPVFETFSHEVTLDNDEPEIIRKSVEANRKRKVGWARQSFDTGKRSLVEQGQGDRDPTPQDTALGLVMTGTHEVRASANGTRVSVSQIVPSFQQSQRFGMQEFANEFFRTRMERQRGRTHSIIEGESVGR